MKNYFQPLRHPQGPPEVVVVTNGNERRFATPNVICDACGSVVAAADWHTGHREACPARTARQTARQKQLEELAQAEALARAPRNCPTCNKKELVPGEVHACRPAPTPGEEAVARHTAEQLAATLRAGGYTVTKESA